jgi:hypothetical protein
MKVCPACQSVFDGHPSAIYCSLSCVQKAKRRRRTQRDTTRFEPPDDSPNQAEYTNISAEDLVKVYNDIVIHIYEKDIKLIGTVPNVPRPDDVIVTRVPGTNYSIAYHKARALLV